MALQLGSLRDALLDAGAKPEKAEKLEGYAGRLASMDSRLSLLTWMAGFNLLLTSGVLWRLLAR